MQNKIIEKIKQYHNIAILGFGREGKSTYNFIRKYDNKLKLTYYLNCLFYFELENN